MNFSTPSFCNGQMAESSDCVCLIAAAPGRARVVSLRSRAHKVKRRTWHKPPCLVLSCSGARPRVLHEHVQGSLQRASLFCCWFHFPASGLDAPTGGLLSFCCSVSVAGLFRPGNGTSSHPPWVCVKTCSLPCTAPFPYRAMGDQSFDFVCLVAATPGRRCEGMRARDHASTKPRIRKPKLKPRHSRHFTGSGARACRCSVTRSTAASSSSDRTLATGRQTRPCSSSPARNRSVPRSRTRHRGRSSATPRSGPAARTRAPVPYRPLHCAMGEK